jgi:hypothetical protein
MDFDDLDDYTKMHVFEKDADNSSNPAFLWGSDKLAEAQAEIERLRAGNWISVDDKLPDIPRDLQSSGVVLVIADDECQSLCTFYEDGSFCDEYQEEFTNVTHWQPLPEPPTEQQEEETSK